MCGPPLSYWSWFIVTVFNAIITSSREGAKYFLNFFDVDSTHSSRGLVLLFFINDSTENSQHISIDLLLPHL